MIFELTLILSAVLSASPVQAPTAPGTVELRWQVGGKARRLAVRLEGLTQSEVERTDLQYARSLRLRGVPLSALLEKLPGDGTLVIAHFENGMVVPLPDAKGLGAAVVGMDATAGSRCADGSVIASPRGIGRLKHRRRSRSVPGRNQSPPCARDECERRTPGRRHSRGSPPCRADVFQPTLPR